MGDRPTMAAEAYLHMEFTSWLSHLEAPPPVPDEKELLQRWAGQPSASPSAASLASPLTPAASERLRRLDVECRLVALDASVSPTLLLLLQVNPTLLTLANAALSPLLPLSIVWACSPTAHVSSRTRHQALTYEATLKELSAIAATSTLVLSRTCVLPHRLRSRNRPSTRASTLYQRSRATRPISPPTPTHARSTGPS